MWDETSKILKRGPYLILFWCSWINSLLLWNRQVCLFSTWVVAARVLTWVVNLPVHFLHISRDGLEPLRDASGMPAILSRSLWFKQKSTSDLEVTQLKINVSLTKKHMQGFHLLILWLILFLCFFLYLFLLKCIKLGECKSLPVVIKIKHASLLNI